MLGQIALYRGRRWKEVGRGDSQGKTCARNEDPRENISVDPGEEKKKCFRVTKERSWPAPFKMKNTLALFSSVSARLLPRILFALKRPHFSFYFALPSFLPRYNWQQPNGRSGKNCLLPHPILDWPCLVCFLIGLSVAHQHSAKAQRKLGWSSWPFGTVLGEVCTR